MQLAGGNIARKFNFLWLVGNSLLSVFCGSGGVKIPTLQYYRRPREGEKLTGDSSRGSVAIFFGSSPNVSYLWLIKNFIRYKKQYFRRLEVEMQLTTDISRD